MHKQWTLQAPAPAYPIHRALEPTPNPSTPSLSITGTRYLHSNIPFHSLAEEDTLRTRQPRPIYRVVQIQLQISSPIHALHSNNPLLGSHRNTPPPNEKVMSVRSLIQTRSEYLVPLPIRRHTIFACESITAITHTAKKNKQIVKLGQTLQIIRHWKHNTALTSAIASKPYSVLDTTYRGYQWTTIEQYPSSRNNMTLSHSDRNPLNFHRRRFEREEHANRKRI